MQPALRVAVLVCDEPIAPVRARYGNFGEVFQRLLFAGAEAYDRNVSASKISGLTVTTWDVVHEQVYPDPQDIDAVIITGSRFDAFENDPWILKLVDFVQRLLLFTRVRLMGVCFGHQVIGRSIGAKVGRNPVGWEVSVVPTQLSDAGKKLFGQDTLSLHQMHKDHVYDPPKEVQVLGSTPDCGVQGMYVKGRFLTTQGHPEFTETMTAELVEARHRHGTFDEPTRQDYRTRAAWKHDGALVSETYMKFLLDD